MIEEHAIFKLSEQCASQSSEKDAAVTVQSIQYFKCVVAVNVGVYRRTNI